MRPLPSERDRLLLQRRFRIKEPQKYPGLTERIEKGAVPVRIINGYDETPQGGRNEGHKPHVRCAFGHLHWKGFIIGLGDGRMALIGEGCARAHFGHEVIDDIERRYNDDRTRQVELRRLLSVRDALPAALTEVRALASHPAVMGFDAVLHAIMHRYGKSSQKLAAGVLSSQGTLIAYRQERDMQATEAAAERAKPALFRATGAAAITAQKRYLEQNPVYRNVPVEMGQCDGWRLLIASERSTPARLVHEAVTLLSTADDGKPIERWGKGDFARLRRALDEAHDKLGTAAGLVADLVRFASPANRERIAAWAKQSKLEIEISLPDGYAWPATPALDALRADATVEHDLKAA